MTQKPDNPQACDLCASRRLVDPVHKIGAFRGVREVCIDCGYVVEAVRAKHAQDAYKYGKPDWHERLMRNARKELKKFYRKKGA